jgi:hypothetical protein
MFQKVPRGGITYRHSRVLAALVVGGLFLLVTPGCGSSSRRSSTPTTVVASPTSVAASTTVAPTTASPTTRAATATTTTPITVPPTTVAANRQILPPATVPPKVDECSQQLTFGADGNVGPITCTNSDLNVLAWQQMAAGNPLVMTLGPYATPSQVEEALCADLRNSTIPIATSAYRISALYYGWSFGIDPSSVLINGGCPSS